jgi:hypothetical protein
MTGKRKQQRNDSLVEKRSTRAPASDHNLEIWAKLGEADDATERGMLSDDEARLEAGNELLRTPLFRNSLPAR